MTTDTFDKQPGGAVPRQDTSSAGLAALQCELRALFLNRPMNRALHEGLQRISEHLGADYAVVHARLGVHLLSEEWERPEAQINARVRDEVHSTLWQAVSDEAVQVVRLEEGSGTSITVAGLMHDIDATPSGGAAFVISRTDRSRALQVLAYLEGILGYLALLIAGENTKRATVAERRAIEPRAAADNPTRLALNLVSEVQKRYACDLVAVGFVEFSSIRVMAVSGMDEVREANPGVLLIRAAMEECYDRQAAIVSTGAGGENPDSDDCRLHAQWSDSCRGSVVASFPLILNEEVVGIVSMRQGGTVPLDLDKVLIAEEEMSGFAALVPLSRQASRGLWRHAVDSTKNTIRRAFRGGAIRTSILAVATILACLWLVFGTIDYKFTVPCTVKAENRRTISCPRDGVLAELFVRPGDHVRKGQLLAVLDAKADILRRDELRAEIDSLDALVDKALAERQTGQLRIHESRKRSLLAQLTSTEASIEKAQIRAPQDGVILSGDLRERLGSRIALGDNLFGVAHYNTAAITLFIPESLVLAARDSTSTQFATHARPDLTFAVETLRVAPESSVVDERNVFLGEASVQVSLADVAPGMEGVAHVNAGPRAAWWVLTHRVTDWLRLNFWL